MKKERTQKKILIKIIKQRDSILVPGIPWRPCVLSLGWRSRSGRPATLSLLVGPAARSWQGRNRPCLHSFPGKRRSTVQWSAFIYQVGIDKGDSEMAKWHILEQLLFSNRTKETFELPSAQIGVEQAPFLQRSQWALFSNEDKKCVHLRVRFCIFKVAVRCSFADISINSC